MQRGYASYNWTTRHVSQQSSSENIAPSIPPLAPPAVGVFSSKGFMPPPVAYSNSVESPNPTPPPPPPPLPTYSGKPDSTFFDFASLNRFDVQPAAATVPVPASALKYQHKPSIAVQPPQTLLARILPFTLEDTPSWLVSLVVHVAFFLLLALIPLSMQLRSSIELMGGMGDDLENSGDLSVFDIDADSSEVSEMSDPTDTITAAPTLQNLGTSDFIPSITPMDFSPKLSIKNGLRGRTGPMKGALLRAYGGTQGTEDAVSAGLKWLAQAQRSDGSWSLVGPYADRAVNENKPAATAMALLAFMGAGNTHKEGEYRERVERGVTFLLKLQNREGFFADNVPFNQQTYAHAQATIAICELYGMTGDSYMKEACQKAVRYCERAQSPGGGWRYQPRENGDTSVTGWYVMALISARMAGLDVDSEVLERVHNFLNLVQRRGRTTQADPDGERYAYQPYSVGTPAMTAEGMLCRLYLGWSTKDPRIVEGAELLVNNPISGDEGRISYYYWYYATTTLHHMGGTAWNEWNQSMKVELPKLQDHDGKEAGSWPPGQDSHASAGGRLYSTCLALYCLESYYRHLPLSEMAQH
jgi:hypothetical protein